MLLEGCARGEIEIRRRGEDGSAGRGGNRQTPLRLILHYVTLLEMHIFAASDGSVSIAPPFSPATVKFFRSNRKVMARCGILVLLERPVFMARCGILVWLERPVFYFGSAAVWFFNHGSKRSTLSVLNTDLNRFVTTGLLDCGRL